MRKRGLCCRPVSVRLSVCLSVTLVDWIHTTEEDIVLFGPVAPSFYFSTVSADTQFQEELLQWGR